MAFADTGAMTKRLHPARSAQLGLESALMAEAGVQGPRNVLENEHGFLRAFSPEPSLESLTSGLGADWRGSKMILKLAPVHAYALSLVNAVNLYRDSVEPWAPSAITDVFVRTGPLVMKERHHVRNPNSLVSAQYSVPFSLAVALTRDLRNPLSFDDSAVADPSVRNVVGKLRFEKIPEESRPLAGTITATIDGATIEIDATSYSGLPGSADYTAAIARKFDQVTHALNASSEMADIPVLISDIAQLTDVSVLRKRLLRASGFAYPVEQAS